MTRPALVIGYGNELRGDDGVGPHVARQVAALGLPGVATRAVQQLVPELAEPLSEAALAIFVDAAAGEEAAVRVSPLRGRPEATGVGHTSNSEQLLALALAVYGRGPRAWLVTVPAADFSFGQKLSAMAERGAADALREVRRLLAGDREGGAPSDLSAPCDTGPVRTGRSASPGSA